MKQLTPVSYGLLGYLALRPFSASELTKIMRTSGVALVWPRTQSRLYTEPANLVAHGLARSREDTVAGRKRTVYRITPKGRTALRRWLDTPGAPPKTEHEALLKVFLANFGTRDQLLDQLAAMRASVDEAFEAFSAFLGQTEIRGTLWPERAHLSRLLMEEFLSTLEARAEWIARAEAEVRSWRDTSAGEDPLGESQRWARKTHKRLRASWKRFRASETSR